MNVILLALVACLFGGCAERTPTVATEPDTEWILAQYKDQNPAVVDARRIREGW